LVYPFDGRLVHAGLAAIVALRLGRLLKGSFAIAQNDYGFELVSAERYPFEKFIKPSLFSRQNLASDIRAGLELSTLARLQFREIARVSGLVFQQHPGARKTARQLQSSSSLIFDVFSEFDPENPLLLQARREVMERQCEESRLGRTMQRIETHELAIVQVARPTPLSMPLLAERMSSRLSTESVLDQLRKMTLAMRE
jgi:ATP-dependent Lhr-like helicase